MAIIFISGKGVSVKDDKLRWYLAFKDENKIKKGEDSHEK
jgi:hypothetical protein